MNSFKIETKYRKNNGMKKILSDIIFILAVFFFLNECFADTIAADSAITDYLNHKTITISGQRQSGTFYDE